MEGARKYARLFKTGQYERMFLVSGNHARGDTFRIQILPEGEEAIWNGNGNNCLNSNAVEVYGVVSGNPGWTETYGWIHKGAWVEDFEKLVTSKSMELAHKKEQDTKRIAEIEKEKRRKEKELLSAYK